MGSLLSGWDSPVLDPKTAKYQRNKSLTRDEIEAFWKSKKQGEGGAASLPQTPSGHPSRENLQLENIKKETVKRYSRSTSMPLPHRRNMFDDLESRLNPDSGQRHPSPTALAPAPAPAVADSPKNVGCWWTSSSWAFLNEPPVMPEANGQSPRRPYVQYSSKFCATQYANPKMDEGGHRQIST